MLVVGVAMTGREASPAISRMKHVAGALANHGERSRPTRFSGGVYDFIEGDET